MAADAVRSRRLRTCQPLGCSWQHQGGTAEEKRPASAARGALSSMATPPRTPGASGWTWIQSDVCTAGGGLPATFSFRYVGVSRNDPFLSYGMIAHIQDIAARRGAARRSRSPGDTGWSSRASSRDGRVRDGRPWCGNSPPRERRDDRRFRMWNEAMTALRRAKVAGCMCVGPGARWTLLGCFESR